MSTVTFNQASNTQLTTLGFTNLAHGSFTDPTNFTTDGSNHAWMNAAFKGSALVFTGGGNGANTKGEVVLAAGTTTSIGNNLEHHVLCRGAAGAPGTTGYSAFPFALATTIVNEMRVRKNNAFLINQALVPTIDLASSNLTYSIRVVNTVDIELIVNGTTYTLSGSGGNDVGGTAVLTGGNSGLAIQNNTASAAGGFLSWTDGLAGSNLFSGLLLAGVG